MFIWFRFSLMSFLLNPFRFLVELKINTNPNLSYLNLKVIFIRHRAETLE